MMTMTLKANEELIQLWKVIDLGEIWVQTRTQQNPFVLCVQYQLSYEVMQNDLQEFHLRINGYQPKFRA